MDKRALNVPVTLKTCNSGMKWSEYADRCVVCIFRPLHTRIARFQRHWNIQRSLIHTFASFILLSYSRFILVSFLLLNRTPLVDINGTVLDYVAFYDGTIPYFRKSHLPFFLLSLPILFIFVIVTLLLLIVPSFARNLSIIRNRWPNTERFIPFMDAIEMALTQPKSPSSLTIVGLLDYISFSV